NSSSRASLDQIIAASARLHPVATSVLERTGAVVMARIVRASLINSHVRRDPRVRATGDLQHGPDTDRVSAPLAPARTRFETGTVRAELVAFGEIQIEGERYARDVVIDRGRVSPRRKGPSKALRDRFRHTPLSAAEAIPWGGHRLIVGTGADGRPPIA